MVASTFEHATARTATRPAQGPAAAVETCDRGREQLQQIVAMRLVAIVAQFGTVLVAEELMGVELPTAAMMSVFAALAVFNAWTWRRAHEVRPVSEVELLCQLSVDVVALALVLGMSGGASNPFAALFLLPVAIGATYLSPIRAWTLAGASIGCYSLLLFVSRPLELPAGDEQRAMIAAAMWLSYFVTAVVIVGVLMRVAFALRRGEQAIIAAQRKAINDEHILRIGALAAGAAHELGSPLCSIALIVRELQLTHGGQPDLDRNLDIMSRQLSTCRETLTTLLSYGNSTFSSPVDRLPFDDFMRDCIDWFGKRRPESTVSLQVENAGQPPRVLANRALRQALTSLLDNAADVSPNSIKVSIAWDEEWLRIRICDRGPGLSADVTGGIGKLFFTTKERGKGNGLGLYLANFVVLRFGGTLTLGNGEGGGAVVEIMLPVSKMSSIDMELGRAR